MPSENWPTLRSKISPTLNGAKWELADAKDWPHGAKVDFADAKDWEFADAGDGQDLMSVTFGGAAKRMLMGKSTTNEWPQCEKGGGRCQRARGNICLLVQQISSILHRTVYHHVCACTNLQVNFSSSFFLYSGLEANLHPTANTNTN